MFLGRFRYILLALFLLIVLAIAVQFILYAFGYSDDVRAWLTYNSDGIYVNLISSLVWAVLIAFVIILRKQIWELGRRLFMTASEKSDEAAQDQREKNYLENLRSKINEDEPKWNSEYFVPLTAVDNYNSLALSPELLLLTRRDEAPSDATGEDEDNIGIYRGKKVDLIELLVKNEKVVVLGEPGSGKTVALRQLSLLAINQALSTRISKRRLPLLLNLGAYTESIENGKPQPVIDFLKSTVKSQMPWADFLVSGLEQYLAQGRLAVLLDGLNQMPATDYTERLQLLKEFAVQWPQSKFIFTCRTLHYDPLFNIREVVISPLTNRRISQLAQKYLGAEEGRRFVKSLESGDRRLWQDCRTPYFLVLAVGVFARNKVLPRTRSALFSQFINTMLQSATRQVGVELEETENKVSHVLRSIAFLMNEMKLLGSEVELTLFAERLSLNDKLYLDTARAAGLVDLAGGKIRFAHHILQEYFAALELKERLESDAGVLKHLRDPWWTETVSLMTGLSRTPERIVNLVLGRKDRTPWDVWLAARCLFSSGLPATGPLYRKISNIIEEDLKRSNVYGTARLIRSLGELADLKSIQSAARYMYAKNPWIQETALQVVSRSQLAETDRLL